MVDTARKKSGNKRKMRPEVTDNKAAIHGYYRLFFTHETGRIVYRNDKVKREVVIFLTTMTVAVNYKDEKPVYHRNVTGEMLDKIFSGNEH